MPKSVMLTHANVSANVAQNLHPGSHTNQTATGLANHRYLLSKLVFNGNKIILQKITKKLTFACCRSSILTEPPAS